MGGSLKGKLFHATKDNTELKQEVAYLSAHLEKTKLSEKMIEDDLSRVEKSTTKSTYKLGVGFHICEDKGGKSAPMFIPTSNYDKEEETIKSTNVHYPSNPKPSFYPKRELRKETPRPRVEAFVCVFCGRAGHLDEFCFCYKRIEEMRFDYARNSYRNEFIDLHLVLLLVLCLASLMDLTISHMVLVLERTALCLHALVTAHVLIMVIISLVGMVFVLECLTLTLSPDTWTVHVFLVMVIIPLVQRVRCKRL
jgi:hypothetical protein